MNRRNALKLTSIALTLLATGCANRTPLAPLKSVVMLPVANVDEHILDTRDINTKVAVEIGFDSNAALSRIHVDRIVPAKFHREMSALKMTVHQRFDEALQARLARDGLSMQRFTDVQAAQVARNNDKLADLGSGADAVVDVRVAALGYRPITTELALTPEAYIELNVVRTADAADIDGAQYSFDRRVYEGDTRHFRCEKGDMFVSVDELMANLPKAASILERGTMLMVDRVADDIVQIYRGKALV